VKTSSFTFPQAIWHFWSEPMSKLLMIGLTLVSSLSLLAQTSSTASSTTHKTTAHKAAATKTASGAKPQPKIVIHTTVGDMHCTLFPDKAPIGVGNFIGLATGKKDWTNPVSHATKHNVPLYDGTIFHRVIPEFMIQGGDAAGNGSGDPGYSFKDEVSSDLLFDRPGRMAYANSGPNTNGSQFFITEDAAHSRQLSGHYTIFGQCDPATVELVKKIARMPRDPSNDRPFHPVRITHVDVIQPGSAPAHAASGTHKTGTTHKAGTTKSATPQQ
jgi:peptidyl-prolyl cis-trans isomerase A (cyclophilin A)